ncbi:MAG: hypothetical protein ACD_69C00089G0001, partial [uncultured bacterium]
MQGAHEQASGVYMLVNEHCERVRNAAVWQKT